MFEKPKTGMMGLRRPLVMAIATGLPTKVWVRIVNDSASRSA
ncbi:hypothetical protein CTAM01_16991 [Colletotrichum tamarilloi]|uniref:Uncharacterized protein n=1 Tax=Colletotrichum tamarilloi TaxID=1209934 RepID=A0ABQ9QGY2_9PEZI|nr:uncharacterized protein CTAM01_16991 [Colletotrichum tamarilloi]KAK1467805.1 hypothetical protein CTAM01_16991 [Colletotrichum tamarilloi]